MATLREYFDADFRDVWKLVKTFQIEEGGESVEFIGRVHLDFKSNSKYLSCYIVKCTVPIVRACIDILKRVDNIFLFAEENMKAKSALPGETPMDSADLTFSGRVFIYSELNIEDHALEQLQAEAKINGLTLQYRGPVFARRRSELEKPLAFISHDSRDKDSIARPIAMGLIQSMRPVWFDEFSLKVGDRLRESIEKGIKECNKCILILSPNFLSNSGWTKTEFNSIFTRELIEKTDLVLPVWCGVSKEQIYEYSPSLLDRVGIDLNIGIDEVVRRLADAIKPKDSFTITTNGVIVSSNPSDHPL